MHTQIKAHLDNNFLLNEIQNGFRKNYSKTDTIFKCTTELQHNKNNKQNTIALYIDFKKAFVNHNILLEKLKSLKIGKTVLYTLEKLKSLKIGKMVLLWVKTYLSNRTQVIQRQNRSAFHRRITTYCRVYDNNFQSERTISKQWYREN